MREARAAQLHMLKIVVADYLARAGTGPECSQCRRTLMLFAQTRSYIIERVSKSEPLSLSNLRITCVPCIARRAQRVGPLTKSELNAFGKIVRECAFCKMRVARPRWPRVVLASKEVLYFCTRAHKYDWAAQNAERLLADARAYNGAAKAGLPEDITKG